MTYVNSTIKTILFTALILTMIIPVTGLSKANAVLEKINVGKVADGSYNEDLAFQRTIQLVNMYDEKMQEKPKLEQKITANQKIYDKFIKDFKFIDAFVLLLENETIRGQIKAIQENIDIITQEYNEIQTENMKLYYIDPVIYDKYVSAKNNFLNDISKQYWADKSFEDAKNAFPLIGAGINHKEKSIEIILFKGIENSPANANYVSIIDKLIPKNIPWFISYGDYPVAIACSSRTSSCDPVIGGLEMKVGNNLLDNNNCTTGIRATRSGFDGFVTAGHCAEGYAVNTNVYQPAFTRIVGVLQVEKYQSNSSCDCAFIADTPGNPTMSNAIYQSGTSSYHPVTATSSGGQAGQAVKKSAVITGNTLGTVTSTNVSIFVGAFMITNLVKSTLFVDCGDSGAPVTNGLGTSFYGILVSKDLDCGITSNVAYHSPYEQIVSEIGANPILGSSG